MATNVYANNREIACKAADGKAPAGFPDVCMSPPRHRLEDYYLSKYSGATSKKVTVTNEKPIIEKPNIGIVIKSLYTEGSNLEDSENMQLIVFTS